MENIGHIKVKKIKCLCGKARMLSVIDPNGKPFSKQSLKEHAGLVNAGCDVETISLEEARETELCFDCNLTTGGRSIKCKLYEMIGHINGDELDPKLHYGFTIGENKVMYWSVVWHPNGNATAYKMNQLNTRARHLDIHQDIVIHYKKLV